MKIQNILIAAALFLSAGIVYAGSGNNGHGNGNGNGNHGNGNGNGHGNGTETHPSFDLNSFESFSWNVEQKEGYKAESTLTVTRIRMNGQGGSSNGWRYYAGGYTDTAAESLEEKLSLVGGTQITDPNYSELLAGLTEEQISAIEHFADPHDVYQFSLTFDDKVKEVGLIGTQGNSSQQEVPTIQNSANNTGNQFYFVEDTKILYYGGTNLIDNNGALFIATLNTTYTEIPKDNPGAAGSPLPTPIVTLLIALGFGAAFVMYRRKQAKV